MEKTKRTNKNNILTTLKEGGYIKYNTFNAKPYLFNRTGEQVGTINFNTYLKLDLVEVPKRDWTFTYYVLRK